MCRHLLLKGELTRAENDRVGVRPLRLSPAYIPANVGHNTSLLHLQSYAGQRRMNISE